MKRTWQESPDLALWMNGNGARPVPGGTVFGFRCVPRDVQCYRDEGRTGQDGGRFEGAYAAWSPRTAESYASVPGAARYSWNMSRNRPRWWLLAAAAAARWAHVPAVNNGPGSQRQADAGSTAPSPCTTPAGG